VWTEQAGKGDVRRPDGQASPHPSTYHQLTELKEGDMRELILTGLVGGIAAVVFRALTGSEEPLAWAAVGFGSGAACMVIIMIIGPLSHQNHHDKPTF